VRLKTGVGSESKGKRIKRAVSKPTRNPARGTGRAGSGGKVGEYMRKTKKVSASRILGWTGAATLPRKGVTAWNRGKGAQ